MIKEVIVVEGKRDAAVVKQAVDAEVIITEGFNLAPRTLQLLQQAYEQRGLIILTDPDSAGERIRRYLSQRFPKAKHAFIPLSAAAANDDIGVELATPAAVAEAIAKVGYQEWQPSQQFTLADMQAAGLCGVPEAAARRAALGEKLGIGYTNAKQFLYRLNHYGVKRENFFQALAELEEEQ